MTVLPVGRMNRSGRFCHSVPAGSIAQRGLAELAQQRLSSTVSLLHRSRTMSRATVCAQLAEESTTGAERTRRRDSWRRRPRSWCPATGSKHRAVGPARRSSFSRLARSSSLTEVLQEGASLDASTKAVRRELRRRVRGAERRRPRRRRAGGDAGARGDGWDRAGRVDVPGRVAGNCGGEHVLRGWGWARAGRRRGARCRGRIWRRRRGSGGPGGAVHARAVLVEHARPRRVVVLPSADNPYGALDADGRRKKPRRRGDPPRRATVHGRKRWKRLSPPWRLCEAAPCPSRGHRRGAS